MVKKKIVIIRRKSQDTTIAEVLVTIRKTADEIGGF